MFRFTDHWNHNLWLFQANLSLVHSSLFIRATNLTLLGYLFLKEGDAKTARRKLDPLFHQDFWSNSPTLWGYLSFGIISSALFIAITLSFGHGFPLFDAHYDYDWLSTLLHKLIASALSIFIAPGLHLSYWEYLRIMEEKYSGKHSTLETKIIDWK
jgi:hypothetical protein